MEWLHVLEMGVKFENEGVESQLTRGPHRKMLQQSKEILDPMDDKPPEENSKINQHIVQPAPSSSKFKELSKHIHGKRERRKRKYKKKQIEYIGYYYEEVNEAKIRDLIEVMSIITNTEFSHKFYDYVFRIVFMQDDDKPFQNESYETVIKDVIPVLLSNGRPLIMSQALKCLYLYEANNRMCNPIQYIQNCSNLYKFKMYMMSYNDN
jgi:hypothetical protein